MAVKDFACFIDIIWRNAVKGKMISFQAVKYWKELER